MVIATGGERDLRKVLKLCCLVMKVVSHHRWFEMIDQNRLSHDCVGGFAQVHLGFILLPAVITTEKAPTTVTATRTPQTNRFN